ncbi:hypothetical protein Fleli_3951 [Bernardetia litoralis DSM 6794]|uniref:Secretion system C-terminal sorting domain-containing protein n=1 Tax=Bernardetia litoralis (strain ATCC 23117 / DSM 6794 / NBRC 15988 / NCIMB 1366 / Fx l1 / Sio-4) TaxID=880071 RepID=I4AQL8_BERLS|nr:T9SS type A sorting domain-containing protein [Bernardetia litoralis]AFM06253.1 hypothetical protein Fleli_3951 [Bernardetia litoralis DSM 6794]
MKFISSLFFIILFIFISFNISAQCTGCDRIISTNTGFSVASGEKVCLTFNGVFTSNINFSGNGTLCVSTNTTISTSISMNINGNNNIINHGTWNKTFNIQNGTTFLNTGTGTVNMSDLTISNGSSFISDNGNPVNLGNVNNNGILDIAGPVTINGDINTNGSGSFVFGSTTLITGDINNAGNMQFNGDATVEGHFNNDGNGNIIINNSTLTVEGNFSNNGDITALGNCGRIDIAGSSTNNGGGNVGMDGSNVDICDVSGTQTGGFDSGGGNIGPNVTNCSCNPTVLPITLTSFTAKEKDNNSVYIDWKTVFELDNDYFQVERSVSGTDFSVIAQIPSQQNEDESYKERSYFVIDNLIDNQFATFTSKQTFYYRLKQVDTNGEFTYSPVVSVRIDKSNNEQIKLLPLQNEWKVESQNSVKVKVYSSIGILKGIYDLNQNQNTISVSNLAQGMYILHLQDSKTGKVTVFKVIR